jgi:hypothetical protein
MGNVLDPIDGRLSVPQRVGDAARRYAPIHIYQ